MRRLHTPARSLRTLVVGALALLALTLSPATADARAPVVDVLTMGPGEDPFTMFGHAAICVTDEEWPQGRCFNYGTADFRNPGPLAWDVIRGEARFWVAPVSLPRVLRSYKRQDRTIYRQRLSLTPDQANAIKAALVEGSKKENKYYVYSHFYDNCSTRIRDVVDAATGGQLRGGSEEAQPFTFRGLLRRGFAPSPPVLYLSELALGRVIDRHPSRWEAMFLPDVLRQSLEERFGARPEVIYLRAQPTPSDDPTSPIAAWFAALAALGAILGALGALAARREGRWPVAVAGAVFGLLGLLIWSLALASPQKELWLNEHLLVLLPLDFALLVLRGAPLRLYLTARVAVVALVALLAVVGALLQPVFPMATLVLLAFAPPCGAMWWRHRRANAGTDAAPAAAA